MQSYFLCYVYHAVFVTLGDVVEAYYSKYPMEDTRDRIHRSLKAVTIQ